MGAQALDKHETCPHKMSCRVTQNPAICVAGLNLGQASFVCAWSQAFIDVLEHDTNCT